ncbi:hypothetical protein EDD22DRAFT_850312 [Suillus occidentalis]|nr:hypothetical protein EDD22DRAFT_850312 [Suillus occidentalis]
MTTTTTTTTTSIQHHDNFFLAFRIELLLEYHMGYTFWSLFEVHDKLPTEYNSRVKATEVDERPTETYTDIGGLEKQIEELVEAIVLPMEQADKFKTLGIKHRKVLGKLFLPVHAQRKQRLYLKLASPSLHFDSEKSGDRGVQRTMLELLNQLDGFSSDQRIKVMLLTIELNVNFEELAHSTDEFNGAQLRATCVEAGVIAYARVLPSLDTNISQVGSLRGARLATTLAQSCSQAPTKVKPDAQGPGSRARGRLVKRVERAVSNLRKFSSGGYRYPYRLYISISFRNTTAEPIYAVGVGGPASWLRGRGPTARVVYGWGGEGWG